ncbi:YqeG family HAD IIIA-type phosphatase [Streptococcus suis]|uniref:YqeG family HAD IIIA-type phosphatase n=1 Tax=Streptococcus suis TaxID=1307 RepID=A0A4T2GYY4_STRSU|nr:YqeG family HAD IIIA-type phosphatase [Streptococcus suis]MBO4113589.1 YqeG family HAD IIIA-type phosphatase [Streptococcus suis]MCL4923479.1 YqeG family HAD IIIA-type phosphatase [Streptococcus suis]TII04748.1 YqeG family HAD IIIA-type phosphatase [Streptococcus suis]HEM5322960.1 YqeG family HAD IIIA-type phosphatase [Streptococcus suis]HEM6589448.1 YqeG family HAD IIIA-type phosphatase [Streptococcus suis]
MSLENYMPDFALEKAYDVTVESLKKHGIKVVFVDLDNTLIAWNNPDGTPEMRQWLHDLQDAGIPVVVVSNNKYERVKRAVEKLGIEFEAFALKPFTFGINRALKRFDVQPYEVIMIGDQLMTDIRAAKRAGLKSVLVKPLLKTDSINTQINRWRERRTMKKIIAKYGAIDYKREM